MPINGLVFYFLASSTASLSVSMIVIYFLWFFFWKKIIIIGQTFHWNIIIYHRQKASSAWHHQVESRPRGWLEKTKLMQPICNRKCGTSHWIRRGRRPAHVLPYTGASLPTNAPLSPSIWFTRLGIEQTWAIPGQKSSDTMNPSVA